MEIVQVNDDNLGEFCRFLHREMIGDTPVDVIERRFRYAWLSDKPRYGYALLHEGRMVGAIGAIYSDRDLNGSSFRLCNISSWCVVPQHQGESLRLLLTLLREKDIHFTNLTASRKVIQILRGLRFEVLDEHKLLVPARFLPRLGQRQAVFTAKRDLEERLDERNLKILRDHWDWGGTASRHILLGEGEQSCYVLYKNQKRRRLKVSIPLYISDLDSFQKHLPAYLRHCLMVDRCAFALIEPRMLRKRPLLSVKLKDPRPPMYRSPILKRNQIDHLYSDSVW